MERIFNRMPADQIGRRVVNGRWDQRKPGRPVDLETVRRPALVIPPPSDAPQLAIIGPADDRLTADELARRADAQIMFDLLHENPVSLDSVHARQVSRYRQDRPRPVTERKPRIEYVFQSTVTEEMPDWA